MSAVPIRDQDLTSTNKQKISSPVPSADPPTTTGEGGRTSSPRGGRPGLSKSEKRRHKFTVSLNDEENEAIEQKAKLVGLSARVYMREASLGMRMRVKGRGEVIHHISRIGVNVNQMTKQLNAKRGAPELDVLQGILAEVRAIRNEL